jgi:hypothetical protein
MAEGDISEYLEKKLADIPIQDFLSGVSVEELEATALAETDEENEIISG